MKQPRSEEQLERHVRAAAQQGITLIELMVGLAVALIVVMAGFVVLTTTDTATRSNDQTVNTQQNARMAMEMMARDIKMAGFGMISTVGVCSIGGNPAPIVPHDQNTGGADTTSDWIDLVVPVGNSAAPAWTINNAGGVGGANGFTSIDLPAGATTNMAAAGLATNSIISIGGAVTTTVTNVSGNTISFTGVNAIPGPAAFPVGIPVYILQCITYDIGKTAAACGNGAIPCLRRNGAVIADGIEDIQFEYGCDGCYAAVNGGVADGIIDDRPTSTPGYEATDLISNWAWATNPMTPDKIRVVRIYIVARQTTAEPSGAPTTAALTVSDHAHASGVFVAGDFAGLNPPYTRYKRRVLTRTVEVRNIGQ